MKKITKTNLISGIALLVVLSFVFVASCKKEPLDPEEPNVEDPNNPVIAAKGVVDLPEGSSLNLSGWNVNSGLSTTQVVNDSFNIPQASNDFKILFASDANDEPRLMGLLYPGQTDFTINSESTVLAMLMKMPPVISLTKQGQINLINAIKFSGEFAATVQEFENSFLQNKPMFDTTNIAFMEKLNSLFAQASLRTDGAKSLETVNLQRAGRTINVQNPGKSYAQKVGVFKGEEMVNSFILDRYVFFAGSIAEIVEAIGNPPEPIEKEFTLQGDGEFVIKVRTGRPPFELTDDLSKDAFLYNLMNVVLDHLAFFLPNSPKPACLAEIRNRAILELQAYNNLYSNSPLDGKSLIALIYKVTESTTELIEISVACAETDGYPSFTKKIKKLLKFVKKVSFISQSLNNAIFVKEFLTDPAATDTCFYAEGNTVKACGGCGDISTVTDIDGNEYPVVQIGEQCWMAENLKTSKYADGSPIPNVTSNDAWAALGSGAWSNYNNSTATGEVYGKLYNWYAVADARNVCPDGWHVPSDAEWTQLELALGMPPSEASQTGWRGSSANVGGQMKATGLWNSPNTGATNSSGFSGLPGGYRNYYDGQFYNLGTRGYWWSATESSSTNAWPRYLSHGFGGVYRNYYYKRNGFSVRCVRD